MKIVAAAAAMAAAGVPLHALAEEPTGRILLAVGICDQSLAEHPRLWFRKLDKSAHFNAGGASFGQWDYADETGKFELHIKPLAAGEWEMFSFEIQTSEMLQRKKLRPRAEYSHRFTVAPGKVVDLGRYCAATQSVGEKFPDSDRVWNQTVRLAYMLVSASRDMDIEKARKDESGGAALEVIPARPAQPERVSPLLRGRFVEPRVIAKPTQQNPTAPSTSPVPSR